VLNKLVFENLRQRPVRTCLSVLAIGVEVTMILTLVGISYGTLDEAARRARGVGADILVRPPASSIISLSSSPMPDKLVPFLMKQPHVTLATGTMGQPLGGFDVLTGIDAEVIRVVRATIAIARPINTKISLWRRPKTAMFGRPDRHNAFSVYATVHHVLSTIHPNRVFASLQVTIG
jgi:hypothetical protein